jgi:catechol 2,3-dioxygenase-like lactoylglutathione lyase family enzyme
MIDHCGSNAADYAATKAFYDAVFAPLGYRAISEFATPNGHVCGFGAKKPDYWIVESKTPATPRHTAFVAPSRAAVDAFHAAALAHGAKDNGAPGIRAHYHPNYYAAFVFDPDGNNVEAVFHGAP